MPAVPHTTADESLSSESDDETLLDRAERRQYLAGPDDDTGRLYSPGKGRRAKRKLLPTPGVAWLAGLPDELVRQVLEACTLETVQRAKATSRGLSALASAELHTDRRRALRGTLRPWRGEMFACGTCTLEQLPCARCRICHAPGPGPLSVWGEGVSLNAPEYVAELPCGDVAVADTRNHQVKIFTADGELRERFGRKGDAPGEFHRPGGLAYYNGAAGEGLFVVDWGNRRVQRISLRDGACEARSPKTTDGDPYSFRGADGVCVAGERLFVTDEDANCCFTLCARTLRFLHRFGAPGLAATPSELASPHGIAFDEAAGRLLVADGGHHRIAVYTLDGAFVREIAAGGNRLRYPHGVGVASGRIYVTDGDQRSADIRDGDGGGAQRLKVLTEEGAMLQQIELPNPSGLCAGERRVFVAGCMSHRVDAFEERGEPPMGSW